MKRICMLLLILAYIISASLTPQAVEEEPVRLSVSQGCHTIDGQQPLMGTTQLITNARSVLLYETTSDTLMYAYNADERLEPASFAKILTALIAIEEGDLSDKVTVSDRVLSTIPKSAVKTEFFDGEILTLKDLLYCMIVDSGNDAAALIADHIAGSQEAFADKMNARAASIGCVDTNFTNAHGINDPMQYSTARDIGRIMTVAIQNETLYQILGTVYYTVPATALSPERNLATENQLLNEDKELYYDPRVTGSRTGAASDGTRCIASIAEDNGLRLISIIMGSASVYEEKGVKIRSNGGFPETKELLNLGFDGYSACQLIYEGQVLIQLPIANGDADVSLGTSESASAVLPDGITMDHITIDFAYTAPSLNAPVEEGTHIAVARYMYNNFCFAEVDLYAFNTVNDNTSTLIQKNKAKNDSDISIYILIIIIVVVILVVLYLRRRYIKKTRRSGKSRPTGYTQQR